MDDDIQLTQAAFMFLEQCRTRMWVSGLKDVLKNCKEYIRTLPDSDIRDDLELLLELALDQSVELADDWELPTEDIYEILEN